MATISFAKPQLGEAAHKALQLASFVGPSTAYLWRSQRSAGTLGGQDLVAARMTERSALLAEIDAILSALSKELSDADRSGGWTPPSVEAMQAFFGRMRLDIVALADLSAHPEYLSIGRGLDLWGVGSGPLFEQALQISAAARGLSVT